jgi:hypothetical protein
MKAILSNRELNDQQIEARSASINPVFMAIIHRQQAPIGHLKESCGKSPGALEGQSGGVTADFQRSREVIDGPRSS